MLIYTQKINRAGMPSRPPHPPAPPPPPWGAGSLPDRRVAVLEGGVDLGKHLGADPRRGPEADARKERKRVAGRSPFVQTFLMVLFLAVLKPPSPKRAQTFMFRGVCGSVGPEFWFCAAIRLERFPIVCELCDSRNWIGPSP